MIPKCARSTLVYRKNCLLLELWTPGVKWLKTCFEVVLMQKLVCQRKEMSVPKPWSFFFYVHSLDSKLNACHISFDYFHCNCTWPSVFHWTWQLSQAHQLCAELQLLIQGQLLLLLHALMIHIKLQIHAMALQCLTCPVYPHLPLSFLPLIRTRVPGTLSGWGLE